MPQLQRPPGFLTLTGLSVPLRNLLLVFRRGPGIGHNLVRQGRGTRPAKGDVVSSALACIGLTISEEAAFSWLLKSACMGINGASA
jgi:hypothetical protein